MSSASITSSSATSSAVASSVIEGDRPSSAVSCDIVLVSRRLNSLSRRGTWRAHARSRKVAADLTDDGRDREALERHPPLGVEPLQRQHETDRANLDEILERLATAGVARRERPDERQVLLEHELARSLVSGELRSRSARATAGSSSTTLIRRREAAGSSRPTARPLARLDRDVIRQRIDDAPDRRIGQTGHLQTSRPGPPISSPQRWISS